MKVNATNLHGWVISQKMPDGDFEWVSKNKYRDMGLLLNYEEGCIAIVDTRLFDHKENEKKNKCFIFKVDSEYPPKLSEREDNYPLAPEVITINPQITGEKQHNFGGQYFSAACTYNRKLICSFLPNKYYVVLGLLLCFYIDRSI